MSPVVRALSVYPVKSCRGIAFTRVQVTERGLLRDREWMVVESAGNPQRFLTQREIPALALIETALTPDALVLRASRMGEASVTFGAAGPLRPVVVWRDTVPAIDEGDEVASWLSEFLGSKVRLVRFDHRMRRMCNPEFAGESGAHTQFADGYPLLVIGSRSLADLNCRLEQKGVAALPMNRFRPNVVVDGLEPYDEDHIRALRFGDVELRLVKPCARCQVTTTDQETAQVGIEPLRTFAGYRHNSRVDGVAFGMNAIIECGAGSELTVGEVGQAEWAF